MPRAGSARALRPPARQSGWEIFSAQVARFDGYGMIRAGGMIRYKASDEGNDLGASSAGTAGRGPAVATKDEDERVVISTHLAPFVVRALQPLFDRMAVKTRGREAVRLADVEMIVGTTDARGRFKSEQASVVQTPGDSPAGYLAALQGVLHELAHQVQSRTFSSEAKFLERWREQNEKYGAAAYDIPGTLEFDAQEFMKVVFSAREALGL